MFSSFVYSLTLKGLFHRLLTSSVNQQEFSLRGVTVYEPRTLNLIICVKASEEADFARNGHRYDFTQAFRVQLVEPTTTTSATIDRISGVGCHLL